MLITESTSLHVCCICQFGEREKISEKIWDPAGNRTQDPLNTSQALIPLRHWMTHGGGGEDVVV